MTELHVRLAALMTFMAAQLFPSSHYAYSQQVYSKEAIVDSNLHLVPKAAFQPMERKVTKLRRTEMKIDLLQKFEGKPPAIMEGDPGQRITPDKLETSEPVRQPRNYGIDRLSTFAHYTDSKVIVPAQIPYRPTGKLRLVAADGKKYECSAALISKSIIITAGHCVHQGGNSQAGWIRSATFYPAYTKGQSNYGRASALMFYTTSDWYNYGQLERGYDVALIVLDKKAGSYAEIGTATGWYAFCYDYCLQPYWSNTQLGYPANYYGGEQMTQSWHLEVSDGYDYVSGSGMEGGSSGGPHVANLGDLSDSATNKGQYASRNVVFAVTSYGSDDARKIQGHSSTSGPNNANGFKSMYNRACTYARSKHGTNTCTLLN